MKSSPSFLFPFQAISPPFITICSVLCVIWCPLVTLFFRLSGCACVPCPWVSYQEALIRLHRIMLLPLHFHMIFPIIIMTTIFPLSRAQVDQIFSVTWVQPRVLDKEQLATLSNQLEGWTEKWALPDTTMTTHICVCVVLSWYHYLQMSRISLLSFLWNTNSLPST